MQSAQYRPFNVKPSILYDLPRWKSAIGYQRNFRLKYRAKSILHLFVQLRQGNYSFRIFGDGPRNKTYVSDCFVPDFVTFSFFPILFRLPDNIPLFRMESFLDHVSDFPDDHMATLLPME
jgi:hypothetical protein